MTSAANATSLSLSLQGAPDHDIENGSPAPSTAVQVMQLELSPDALRDLQRSAKASKPIAVGFGKHMYLRYGTTSKPLKAEPSHFRQELYEASKHGDADSHMSFRGLVSHKLAFDTAALEPDQGEAAADAALERMRQQFADIDKDKKAHQTQFLNRVIDTKQRAPIPTNIPRSAPSHRKRPSQQSTPMVGTPSLQAPGPHAPAAGEAHRFVFLHLLAMGPASEDHIHKMTAIPVESISNMLDRYCEKSESGKESQWSLIPRRFKELDVWRFPYGSDEDRKAAIENAIRALDKIRLDPADKIWQSLLPRHERGKGRTLSRASLWPTDHRKMLSNIDGGMTPQADKSAESSQKRKDAPSDAEAATRPPPQKVAKMIKPKPKSSSAQPATAKGKPGAKALSSERIEDSDEEFEQAAADEKAPIVEAKKAPSPASKTSSPPPKTAVAEKAPAAVPKKELSPPARTASPPPKKPAPKTAPPKAVVKAASPAFESVIVKKRKLPPVGIDAKGMKPGATAKASAPTQSATNVESSPQPKRVKAEADAPKPVIKAAKPAATTARPVTNGIANKASKPATNGNGIKTATSSNANTPTHKAKSSTDSLKAGSPDFRGAARNGTRAGSPLWKSSTPPPSSSTKTAKPASATKPKPAAPSDQMKRYNSLVQEYNALPPSSARRRALITDIRALRNRIRRSETPTSTTLADKRGSNMDVPLSHRQTLESYRRYHTYFKGFCALSDERKTTKTTPEQEQKYHDQSARLVELQKDVLAGFDSMLAAFRAKPVGRVVRADVPASALLRQDAAETQSWKARAKFLEWKAKYEDMRNNRFGDVHPDDMVALWDELGAVQRLRDGVLRSVALAYGRREEGRLEDVELERVFA